MRTLIVISWRNVWRNRTRSSIIIIAIVLGIMGGIFSAAMRLASETQQFEENIERQISHLQIHHPRFIANPEARFLIPDGKKVAEDIRLMQQIKTVSPRSVLDGMINSANMNAGVRIKGIDPNLESQTTGLNELLVEGSYFELESRLPTIVIGKSLASKLKATIGSRVVLTFQDIDGDVVSASFRIEGLYAVTSRRFEETTVFVKQNEINNLIGDINAVTEIAILLNNPDKYLFITDELIKIYPDLEVRNWVDIDPIRYYAVEILSKSLIWILVIIIMALSFGLLNIILMSILERVRELGMLMAIGMKRAKVFIMVVFETIMVSVIGGFIGLFFSYVMIRILNVKGVKIPGGEGLKEFGYSPIVYPDINVEFYYQIAILIVLFAILASIYPALKAIRLVPAKAVRME